MQSPTIEKGQDAESVACDYLAQQGLKLVERNFRCPRGEIDIIMEHQQAIVFIEVRYRHNSRYGSGAETVTTAKQTRLITTAQVYLQKHPQFSHRPGRFDVVSISQQQGAYNIDWIRDAFQN